MGNTVMEGALEGDAVLHPVAALPPLAGFEGRYVTEAGVSLDLWLDAEGRPMARQHGVAFALGPRADGMLHALRGGFRFALERRGDAWVLHNDAGHHAALHQVENPPALQAEGRYHCADVATTWTLGLDAQWSIDGPLAKGGPHRAEPLTEHLARFHQPGALYDSWWDVVVERDATGVATALVASGARAWGLRFERVG
jgi:hypothetical protein